MNKQEVLDAYEKSIYEKVDRLCFLMEKNEAIKTATIKDGNIYIEFTEEVDIEGQDIVGVFIKGGAIKKTASKDNIEDQYFEIPAIGELM